MVFVNYFVFRTPFRLYIIINGNVNKILFSNLAQYIRCETEQSQPQKQFAYASEHSFESLVFADGVVSHGLFLVVLLG